MRNAFVLIITGNDMGVLSNNYYEMKVPSVSDHGFILEEFMLEKKIDYPFWDYCFSHDAVKLAILGNIVILIGGFCHILSLPDSISCYQKDMLEKLQHLFCNESSCFSIMNTSKELDRTVYEGISSSVSKDVYDELIQKKYQKWKDKSKILKR